MSYKGQRTVILKQIYLSISLCMLSAFLVYVTISALITNNKGMRVIALMPIITISLHCSIKSYS